jgi:hypothetical protein
VKQESKGLYADDEGYKMATTDAISVACKMLGFASDVYEGKVNSEMPIGTKYESRNYQKTIPKKQDSNLACSDCGVLISDKVAEYSEQKFKKKLCYDCQKKH